MDSRGGLLHSVRRRRPGNQGRVDLSGQSWLALQMLCETSHVPAARICESGDCGRKLVAGIPAPDSRHTTPDQPPPTVAGDAV